MSRKGPSLGLYPRVREGGENGGFLSFCTVLASFGLPFCSIWLKPSRETFLGPERFLPSTFPSGQGDPGFRSVLLVYAGLSLF